MLFKYSGPLSWECLLSRCLYNFACTCSFSTHCTFNSPFLPDHIKSKLIKLFKFLTSAPASFLKICAMRSSSSASSIRIHLAFSIFHLGVSDCSFTSFSDSCLNIFRSNKKKTQIIIHKLADIHKTRKVVFFSIMNAWLRTFQPSFVIFAFLHIVSKIVMYVYFRGTTTPKNLEAHMHCSQAVQF